MELDCSNQESARIVKFRQRIARHVQCRSCGYEPPRPNRPRLCPKCGGGCWEMFARIGKLRSDPPASRPPARAGMTATAQPATAVARVFH